MDYWTSYFEGAMVSDLTPARVAQFAEGLKGAGKSSGYIRRILADGKAALNGAYKRGEIVSVPYIDLSLAPEGEPRQRILTVEEMAALFDVIEAPHVRNYLILAIGTMARPQAITDLSSFAVDWHSGSINLLPAGKAQTHKYRPIVPMVARVRDLCANIPPGPLVSWHGQHVRSVRTTFRKAIIDAGLENTGVCRYTLRHTVISEAMKRCDEPWQVETFAGHRTGHKTTARYIKFSPGYLSKAAAAIDKYFNDIEAQTKKPILYHLAESAFELRSSAPLKLVGTRGFEPPTPTPPV